MTQSKREPFAKVFEYGINVGEIEVYSESDDKEVVAQINAALNARVDDEVREAVEDNEEFKAKLIESMICPEDADPVWAHGFKVAQVAIAKVIRAKNLPRELREPEGKP